MKKNLIRITKEEADKLVQKGKAKYLNYGYAKHYLFFHGENMYINRGNYYEKRINLKS